MIVAPGEMANSDVRQPGFALRDDEEIGERLASSQVHVRPVRDDNGPVRRRRIRLWRADELVILRIPVGQNQELSVAVIDGVHVIGFARQDDAPGPGRILGRQHARFRRCGRRHGRDEKLLVARAAHAEPVEFIRFLVNEHVGVLRRAKPMPPQFVSALGGILRHVEDRGVVGRPRNARHLSEPIGQNLAGAQVLDEQLVLAESGRIGRVREQIGVVADLLLPQREEFVTLRHRIAVKEDFFRGLKGTFLATMHTVLLALLFPRVVPIVAAADGH